MLDHGVQNIQLGVGELIGKEHMPVIRVYTLCRGKPGGGANTLVVRKLKK